MAATSVVGLDIGGSTTRGRLVVDGAVAAEASAGSASLAAAGERLAEANLRALLATLGPGPLDAVCAGAAGSGAAPARAWLVRTLQRLTGAARVSVVDDAELVLPAAGHEHGIAIVCGTGSIVDGRGPAAHGPAGHAPGPRARAGGWGRLLGDEGSGYALVRGALRTVLSRRDAGEPAGPLQDALLSAGAAPTLDALLVALYGDPRPERWAALAPAVLACPDPAVAGLRDGGARALAAGAAAVARRLGLTRSPVVLAGGLVADPSVRAALHAALAAELPGWPVELLRAEPVAGAVALAQRAALSRA